MKSKAKSNKARDRRAGRRLGSDFFLLRPQALQRERECVRDGAQTPPLFKSSASDKESNVGCRGKAVATGAMTPRRDHQKDGGASERPAAWGLRGKKNILITKAKGKDGDGPNSLPHSPGLRCRRTLTQRAARMTCSSPPPPHAGSRLIDARAY